MIQIAHTRRPKFIKMSTTAQINPYYYNATALATNINDDNILVGSNLGLISVLKKISNETETPHTSEAIIEIVDSHEELNNIYSSYHYASYNVKDNSSFYPINHIHPYKDDFYLSASVNQINGWKYDQHLSLKELIKQHTYDLIAILNRQCNDKLLIVNDLCTMENHMLCSIGGYGVCCIDLERQMNLNIDKFSTSNLLSNSTSVKEFNGCCVVSTKEGHIYFYDLRTNVKEPELTLSPFKDQMLWHDGMDKYINNIAIHPAGWIVASGGPKMSLWHLKTLSLVDTLSEPNKNTNQLEFGDSNIISVGNDGYICRHNLMGELELSYKSPLNSINSFVELLNEDCCGGDKTIFICGDHTNIYQLSDGFLHRSTVSII